MIAAGVAAQAKWPNDLVVGGAKLAGLLSETAGVGSGRPAVVVGVGINVSWPMPGPEADELGATCLEAVSDRGPVERESLLGSLLDGVERRRPLLDDVGGRSGIVDELARCTATIGRPVRVELPGRDLLGHRDRPGRPGPAAGRGRWRPARRGGGRRRPPPLSTSSRRPPGAPGRLAPCGSL